MLGNKKLLLVLFVLIVGLLGPTVAAAQSDDEAGDVVRAVLFYSPTCPHCHHVINEVLVPMTEEYGDKLQLLGVDTTQPGGGQLYQATIEHFEISPRRQGVPTLVIGDVVLVGSGEIPAKFPDMVKEHLAAGGIDWPDIPGLVETISASEEAQQTAEAAEAAQPAEATEETQAADTAETAQQTEEKPTPSPSPPATATTLPTPTPTPAPVAEQSVLTIGKDSPPPVEEIEVAPPDSVGMALATFILLGMLVALGFTIWRVVVSQPDLFQLDRYPAAQVTTWLIPILSLVGLGAAMYLAYVEITHIEAVCGPVGECNIVQASPYAQILGIPVAVLGMLNYLAIIFLWLVQKLAPGGRLANLSALALLGLTFFGTLFSIYLTLLEIFVIQAVCAWCLSSAIITTVLMLLVVMPITRASGRLQPGATSA